MSWYNEKEAVGWVRIESSGVIDFKEWQDRVPREYCEFFLEVIEDTYRYLYGDGKPVPGQENQFATAVCAKLRLGPGKGHSAPITTFYLH